MKTLDDFNISIPLGRTGEVTTTCPQCSPHRQKNPKARCLSVNVEKGVWHCNHCDWAGTLKEGVKDRSNPYANSPKTYRKPTYSGVTPDGGKMLEWFASRSIPTDVVRRNRISVGQVYMPQVEAEVSAIRFPFFRNGEVVNIKSRDKDKNFRMETGAERVLYGMDDCNGHETLIIVEGEIDKLSVEVAGFVNCVSVPDGAPSPKSKDYTSKFSFLENCEEFLAGFKRVILAVDSDAPGQKLEEELARRIGAERCARVEWPIGCKDANEVLITQGKEVLQERLVSARPYPVSGIFEVADFATSIDRMYEKGLPPGAKPGWPSLNHLITFQPGQWTVVTGIPGHGKSELLDAILVNLAAAYGWTFAIFSPENQPLELHFQKLAEKYVCKPFFGPQRMTRHELDAAKSWISERFTFVLPEADGLSVDNVLNLARVAVRRKGVQGVILDPWNELDHARPPSLSETEYISASLTKIRRFARENGVHVWLVAHPAKLRKEKNDRGEMVYPVPTPYDISGSAHWRNKADNALTVYREVINESNLVQVHVQKVRFKYCGKPGVTELRYDRMTGRYDEPYGTASNPNSEE
jgi:twinkle protein